MALFLSATDVALAQAQRAGTLRMEERTSRLGGTFVALSDDRGLLEVADDWAAAQARVQACGGR